MLTSLYLLAKIAKKATLHQISGEKFHFSQKEFAKIRPFYWGAVSPLVSVYWL
jgi:hypothetical protein